MSARRPNIVLIMADQMRHDCLGVDNPAIRTPHLDRLAASGTLFSRAYPPTPVCLPCRAALLSGQYCSTNGAPHNMSRLPEDHDPSLGRLFSEAGYYTHFIGKSHLASCHDPCSPESFPHIANYDHFERWHGPWYGFQRADLAIGHSNENHARGMHYGAWLRRHGVDLERHFGRGEYTDYGAWDLPEELQNAHWTAQMAIEGMDRAADRPFFLFLNFQDPHNPCMVSEPWASMYDPQAIPRFGYKPGEPNCYADKPPFYRGLIDQPGAYAARGIAPGLNGAGNVCHLDWDQDRIQGNAACYYGQVSLMDQAIGTVLDALDERGLGDDTLVLFTADHGDLLGDHGMWFKSLVCYEESIRVPMIASWPGRIPAGRRCAAFQSLVDYLPSLCSCAGLPIPYQAEGVDQRAVWEGEADLARADVVVEERPEDGDWNQRILIDDGHKCVFYASHPENGELYDMRADPDHIVNLWRDPVMQEVRNRMIARILTHEMNKAAPRPGWSETFATCAP